MAEDITNSPVHWLEARIASGTAVATPAVIAAVATADADATYGQPEADLINELKSKYNTLLTGLKALGIIASS